LNSVTLLPITIIVVIIILSCSIGLLFRSHIIRFSNQPNAAYAHFFGISKNIDNYQIVFQPFPIVPEAGQNSTLNFSILGKDNANVNNVYAALTIREKNTSKVVTQIPTSSMNSVISLFHTNLEITQIIRQLLRLK